MESPPRFLTSCVKSSTTQATKICATARVLEEEINKDPKLKTLEFSSILLDHVGQLNFKLCIAFIIRKIIRVN